MVLKRVEIFTDGACSGNPGPGAWAAILRCGGKERELSGYDPATTNNRMELTAPIKALRALKERCKVTLCTESEYVRDGITKWIETWKQKRWKTAKKKPVKNSKLWVELDRLCSCHNVEWRWDQGLAGHSENERCDQLAHEAIRNKRGISGNGSSGFESAA